MSRKVFTAGEVLAAADVNSFLMDQSIMSFAGTAARGSAIPSPVEGMYTHLEDTDALQFWNGSAWIPAARSTGAGLVHIETRNVSAVTVINFNNVFTSTYRAYKVVVTGSAAARTPLYMRLRASGVDASGSNYVSNAIYRDQLGLSSFTETGTETYAGYIETGISVSSFDVGNPFEATNTAIGVLSSGVGTNGILWLTSGAHNLSNSYDGMRLSTNSNFTGQITIYGYRN